jgi:hypothetical protein
VLLSVPLVLSRLFGLPVLPVLPVLSGACAVMCCSTSK